MTVLESLSSHNVDEIIDAIYALGGARITSLGESTIASLGVLLSHSDPQVREAVATQGGVRLRLAGLLPAIMCRLGGAESESEVLIPLLDAATAIVLHGSGERRNLSMLLAEYVGRESENDEVRGTAYLCLLKLWGLISANALARSPTRLSELSWDPAIVSASRSGENPAARST